MIDSLIKKGKIGNKERHRGEIHLTMEVEIKVLYI